MNARTEHHVRRLVWAMCATIKTFDHRTGITTPMQIDAGEVIAALNRAERGLTIDREMEQHIAILVDVAERLEAPINLKIAHAIAERAKASVKATTNGAYSDLGPQWTETVQVELGKLAVSAGYTLTPTTDGQVFVIKDGAPLAVFATPETLRQFLLARLPTFPA
jgi:hypothetical protein